MLKLYGFAVSNYFNMVKQVLLLKGIPFEEVTVFPSQEADYLARSPMGKVPCLETEQGFLSETTAILAYLEASHPQPSLIPGDAWGQAKMHELIKVGELYLELSARRLLPALLFNQPLSEETKKEARAVLERGFRALGQLARFDPYLLGEQQTLADIFLRYCLIPAKMAAQQFYQWDALAEVEGLAEWESMMAADPIAQQLDAAMHEQLGQFMQEKQAQA